MESSRITMCSWCHFRLGKATQAKWESTGDEADNWCDDHKRHANNPVRPILDEPIKTGLRSKTRPFGFR